MVIIFISLISILLLSRVVQTYVKIPVPLTMIVLTFALYNYRPEWINISAHENFDQILLLLLPLVLLPDTLHLKLKDIKRHAFAIFYLSVVAVVLSILLGTLLKFALLSEYNLTFGMMVGLFSMVLATDAVSVGAIFSQFKLPHDLKVLTEGESLFNDATAVIAFFFIAIPLINGVELTSIQVGIDIVRVITVSVLIGFVVGFIAKTIMSWLHNSVDEFIIILLTAYSAFEIAEFPAIHVSGILSLIVAVLTLKYYINLHLKSFEDLDALDDDELDKNFTTVTKAKLITTKAKLAENEQIIGFFALFANALLFFSLAELINIDSLLLFANEIIIVFIATTLIRAAMMLKFSFISRQSERITSISYRWWSVLTFAGIKGGLSIIMVHSLPETFLYKSMFENIVMGVVLLSIFVNATALLLIVSKYKEKFLAESQMKQR